MPQLAVNELYPGPDADDVCACNSIVYSLLSACAACQSRFYIDWTSWTTHCATIIVAGFPKTISNDIAVPRWAYNNMTNASVSKFDIDQAIETTAGGTITHTRAQASTVPASTASDSAPGHLTGTSKGLMIVGSVVGSVVAAYLVIWLVLRWARRRAGKPLSEGQIYRPLVQIKIPYEPIDNKSLTFSPLKEMDITSRDQDTNHPFASSGYSGADLPGYLFTSPGSDHQQSPAIESSELFTTVGGHSSSAGHDLERRSSVAAQSPATSARTNPIGRRGAFRGVNFSLP